MITMIGQGLLYRVHRERQYMLNKMERRRAMVLACLLVTMIGTVVWLLH
jgi:hypothetical protein